MHLVVDYPGTEFAGATHIAPLPGGEFSGPRLSGAVLGGRLVGSWATGWGEEEATATLRTDDGVTILMRVVVAVTTGDQEEILKVMSEELPDPSKYHCRNIVRFEVGDERYDWLNSMIAVGVITLNPAGPDIDLYSL